MFRISDPRYSRMVQLPCEAQVSLPMRGAASSHARSVSSPTSPTSSGRSITIARPDCRPSVMHVNTTVTPCSSLCDMALHRRPTASVKTRSPPEGRESCCWLVSFGIRCSAFLLACRRNRQFARGGKPNPTWRHDKGGANETGGAFLAPPAHRNDCASGVPVDAAREIRVVLLFLRHRQVQIRSVRRATVVVAFRKDGVRRPAVLPDEATHVAQSMTARECPECLFPEQQVFPRRLRPRIDQRRHHGNGHRADGARRATQGV